MREAILKHWDIWKESLAEDRERLKTKLTVQEADFLPAALEILEKPASPIGRGLMWTLIAFCVIALAWSFLGHIDIVATAQGKLIPRGHVKTIQPAELGVVKRIAVENGQQVKAGDLLIQLDTTISGADKDEAFYKVQSNRLIVARQNALLAAAQKLESPKARNSRLHPQPDWPADAPAGLIAMHQHILDSRLAEYQAGLLSLESQLEEKQAELQMTKTEFSRLTDMMTGLNEQLSMRKQLLEKGLNSRLVYLDTKQKRDEQQKNMDVDRDKLVKDQAAANGIKQQIAELKQKFRKDNLAELADAEDKASQADQDLTKATKRTGLQELRSPIDGTVSQLKVHTVGGVVQPGQELLTIVPVDGALAVEALVLNQDIGFVLEGQEAEIKLEAFPYTRYGVINGKIEDVSDDAMTQEQADPRKAKSDPDMDRQGLVYLARVSLAKTVIEADGKHIPLTPGMAATVEIKTGKRRLIDYFLSPIIRYKNESLRER